MKLTRIFLASLLLTLFLSSCEKDTTDEITPLVADFEVTLTGEAPNATIYITNKTTGASSFEWSFSEGTSIDTVRTETPANFTVDKAGEFTITLAASNDTEEKTFSKTVTIGGNSAILLYEDIEFALNADDPDYGRLFSTSTGTMYKDNELTLENGPTIDLAFGSMGRTMYYFESPDVASYNVPNATKTKVINYNAVISISDFSIITDEKLLKDLVIEDDNESFGNSSFPHIVLFENSKGRKGAIKVQALNGSSVLVDIKMQKY